MGDNFPGDVPLLQQATQLLQRLLAAFRAWTGEFDHLLDLAQVYGLGTRFGYWCFSRALTAASILQRLERAMLLVVRHMRDKPLQQQQQQQ